MGRLTTIEDVEKREAAQDEEQMRAAQEAMLKSRPAPEQHSADDEPASPQPRVDNHEPAPKPVPKSQAQQETDFHGLNDLEKKSGGHIALIVVAVVIVVAAALKIANVF